MEQLSELFNVIGGIVTTILLPLLGVFMFHDQKKRKEEAPRVRQKLKISPVMLMNGKNFTRRKRSKYMNLMQR